VSPSPTHGIASGPSSAPDPGLRKERATIEGKVLALAEWEAHEVPLNDEEKQRVKSGGAVWMSGCDRRRSAVFKIQEPGAGAPGYVVDLHERYEAFSSLTEAISRFGEAVHSTIRGLWSLQEYWSERGRDKFLVMDAKLFSGRLFTLRQLHSEDAVANFGLDHLRDYTFERAGTDLEKALAEERQAP
jgi:hypothetical protein